jgi:hypothetical protein
MYIVYSLQKNQTFYHRTVCSSKAHCKAMHYCICWEGSHIFIQKNNIYVLAYVSIYESLNVYPNFLQY